MWLRSLLATPFVRIAEFVDVYFDNSVNILGIKSLLNFPMARLTTTQCITKYPVATTQDGGLVEKRLLLLFI